MPEITPSTAPRSRAITCDPDGPLVAEVVKTTSDPYVGRISLVRVFSGTLRPDMTVHVSGTRRWPTAGTRTTTWTSGSAPSPARWASTSATVAKCVAGDIVAVAKLSRAETGDTLSDKDSRC